MIRENLLKAKHDEISTCLTSRKRKLRELYSISFATVNIDAGDQSHRFNEGLASFLNANNLQDRGRRFDVSSLRFGHGKSAREDSRDKSTQAGPPLPQTDSIVTKPRSLSPFTASTSFDKSKSGFAQISSSQTPSTLSQHSIASTSHLPHPSSIAKTSLPSAIPQATERNGSSASDQRAQPHKPGHTRPSSTYREDVALTSGSHTSALPEDRACHAGRNAIITDENSSRPQENRQLPTTETKVVAQQTNINSGGPRPSFDVTEIPRSATPPKVAVPLPSIAASVSDKVNTPLNASSDEEARPPHLFHAGPSTPEEQLRREEAQSLNAFSPQTELVNSQRPASQVIISSNSGNGTSTRTTSPDHEMVNRPSTNTESRSALSVPIPFQSQRAVGMLREVSRDLTLSQRPPIHINTTVAPQGHTDSPSDAPDQTVQPKEKQSAVNGPSKIVAPAHPSSPARMTTRVSSGALRQKSVSEILGETPKPSSHPVDKSLADTLTPESPSLRSRQSEFRERERERSKLSTVVFAKQLQTDHDRSTETKGQEALQAQDEHRDYLLSLFHYQASQSQSPGISALLGASHKTLTTANQFTDLHEKQMYRITRRIYDMQNTHHWPLRQVERSVEPVRPATHWDALMGHIKWLRTDFREERKWKLTLAKNLADWCAEWVVSSPERRPLLQIKVTKRSSDHYRLLSAKRSEKRPSVSHSNLNDDGSIPASTPDLVPSREDDSSDFVEDDSPTLEVARTRAPAAIFSLAPEDVVFELKQTPVADRLLSELCLYRPWIDTEAPDANSTHRTFDNEWNTPLLPVSKYTAGKLQFVNNRLPHKRSRYDYESESEGSNSQPAVGNLQPDSLDVALFDPENKPIRDRVHAGHAFRPPSEYPMPSQSFFEARQSSQWMMEEDDELKRLVRDYAYNWSLISSCLTFPSLFTSGAERRTPWECFERWVALEGLPNDMAKTHYFKAYDARLHAAQRTINANYQTLQQQHANNPQIPIRKRTSLPVRVERRRNNKHLVMIQAMAKLARRRETAAQKQQHGMETLNFKAEDDMRSEYLLKANSPSTVAGLAAMRKANETVQPRQRIQTPHEWSRFKYDRECKRQEQQKLQMEQAKAQKALMAQQQAGSSMAHTGRNPVAVAAATNAASPRLGAAVQSSQLPSGSQGQVPPIQVSQPLANGVANPSQMPNGQTALRGGQAPQAQMSYMPGPAQRVYAEAGRVQQEQQRYLEQREQQRRLQNHALPNGQTGGHSPVASTNTLAHQSNAAMMASMQPTNGVPSPSSTAAQPAARLVSPRPSASVPVQPLSSGMMPVVSNILNHLKSTRPDLSPEQQKLLANRHLDSYRQQQNAMQAAAGHGSATPTPNYQYPNGQRSSVNGGNPMLNHQMYTQMLRSQQSSQQYRNGVSGHNGNLRPPSRDSQQPPTQSHRASVGSNGLGQSP